jgi:hypothetical protein
MTEHKFGELNTELEILNRELDSILRTTETVFSIVASLGLFMFACGVIVEFYDVMYYYDCLAIGLILGMVDKN